MIPLQSFLYFERQKLGDSLASEEEGGWGGGGHPQQCSGESTLLPPMRPGFDSHTWRHMWVEFVVGTVPCSKNFFSGYSSFLLSKNSSRLKFRFVLEQTDIY